MGERPGGWARRVGSEPDSTLPGRHDRVHGGSLRFHYLCELDLWTRVNISARPRTRLTATTTATTRKTSGTAIGSGFRLVPLALNGPRAGDPWTWSSHLVIEALVHLTVPTSRGEPGVLTDGVRDVRCPDAAIAVNWFPLLGGGRTTPQGLSAPPTHSSSARCSGSPMPALHRDRLPQRWAPSVGSSAREGRCPLLSKRAEGFGHVVGAARQGLVAVLDLQRRLQ